METKFARRDMRVVFVLLLLISGIVWGSCSGGGGGGNSSGPAISPKPLSWVAPTLFADGGTLNPSQDLSTYEIYINETGIFLLSDTPRAVFPAVDASSGAPVTTYDLAKIVPPLQVGKTYFLAMRTVEKNGGKSGFSDPPIQFIY
jgi:hypothetical protein